MDGIMDLGGLTLKAQCPSGYSHYPPPQATALLSPSALLQLAIIQQASNTD